MLSTDPKYIERRKLAMKVGAGIFAGLTIAGLIVGMRDKTFGIKGGLSIGAILGLIVGSGVMMNISPRPDDK